jgi:hypothetical protein
MNEYGNSILQQNQVGLAPLAPNDAPPLQIIIKKIWSQWQEFIPHLPHSLLPPSD